MDIFWTFYLNHLSPLWGYFTNLKKWKYLDIANRDLFSNDVL